MAISRLSAAGPSARNALNNNALYCRLAAISSNSARARALRGSFCSSRTKSVLIAATFPILAFSARMDQQLVLRRHPQTAAPDGHEAPLRAVVLTSRVLVTPRSNASASSCRNIRSVSLTLSWSTVGFSRKPSAVPIPTSRLLYKQTSRAGPGCAARLTGDRPPPLCSARSLRERRKFRGISAPTGVRFLQPGKRRLGDRQPMPAIAHMICHSCGAHSEGLAPVQRGFCSSLSVRGRSPDRTDSSASTRRSIAISGRRRAQRPRAGSR